jgi:SAM-dependent methyltransferase
MSHSATRPADPLRGSSWSAPETVAGFARGSANAVLVRYAGEELRRTGGGQALDVGCGAARNASALARLGWRVLGTDLSWPMLTAARDRMRGEGLQDRFLGVLAPMERLPVASGSCDLIVAHGIWNLARSAAQFRAAVDEAARAGRPGAALFVFTFSRHTLPEAAEPVRGEPFVFTQFFGEPACFLSEAQLDAELARAGFVRDSGVPLTEYNRQQTGSPPGVNVPVIYEAAYRLRGAGPPPVNG